jgi:hypothetical protein
MDRRQRLTALDEILLASRNGTHVLLAILTNQFCDA